MSAVEDLPWGLLDEMNSEMREVEDALIAAGLLLYTSIPMLSGDTLVWACAKGEWGFFVDKQDGVRYALGTVSARLRFEAAGAIPVLVEVLRRSRKMSPSDVSTITPAAVQGATVTLRALRANVEGSR